MAFLLPCHVHFALSLRLSQPAAFQLASVTSKKCLSKSNYSYRKEISSLHSFCSISTQSCVLQAKCRNFRIQSQQGCHGGNTLRFTPKKGTVDSLGVNTLNNRVNVRYFTASGEYKSTVSTTTTTSSSDDSSSLSDDFHSESHSSAASESDSNSSETAKDTLEAQIFGGLNYRISETDPRLHNALHMQKFYSVPEDVCKTFQYNLLLRKDFAARAKAFNETAFMVRAAVLEARELLAKMADADKIAAKVLLYGVDGCGKSIAFAQLLHSAFNDEQMIICPLRQYLWNNYFSEVAVSAHKVM